MQNFVFHSPTKIIFGRGTEEQVGGEVKKYCDRVLLHYGGGSIKRYGLYEKALRSLEESGIEVIELAEVKPNPRLSLVHQGIKICREREIRFILAVGGGSVIDSAKAIALGVPYDGEVWDFYTGKAEPQEALPIGVVLTIPASGSEASKSTVITNEEGWYKLGYNNELVKPRFAIMNPELTYTLPSYQTSCGAADILAHVMERYFTKVSGVDFTDRLCEATMKTVINNTPVALREPENYSARAQIMWASTIAHNDLLSTGRIADFGSHKIEHELSALYDVAHGAGLAVIFPAWMKHVYKEDMERFIQFAVRVFDVDLPFTSPEEIVLEGIRRLTDFFREIGLPTTLKELNIPSDRLEEMAERCVQRGPVGSFRKLQKNDVLEILRLAL